VSESCPACSCGYTSTLEVEVGDAHRQLFGGPPHTLFARYVRLCAHPEDSRGAGRSANQEVRLFLHTSADLNDTL